MYRLVLVGAMVLLAGCGKSPAPSADVQVAPPLEIKDDKKSQTKNEKKTPPSPSRQSERVVVSGWAIENPTLVAHGGKFQDKTVEIKDSPTSSHPFTINPKAGDRLVVLECKMTATTEDANALDAFSTRRKSVFSMGDETFRFLSGDGRLAPETLKQLTGRYRVFDMERVELTDGAGKSYMPLWCIAPEPEYTFIFTPSGGSDILEKWSTRNAELLPAAGKLAVRTNSSKFLKTNGLFVSLMELNQPASFSILYAVPGSIPMEGLKVVVEGGTPVSLKTKK